MAGWWMRYPKQFEAEKSALDKHGFKWKERESDWQQGLLVIDATLEYEGQQLELMVCYPDSYPYFAPQVTLKNWVYDRHQHPFGKNLCLLAREAEDWKPGEDTFATLLVEQLPRIKAINAGDATTSFIAKHEDHVGEPTSSFLDYQPNCTIIVPDLTPDTSIACGRLILDVRSTSSQDRSHLLVNGAIREIQDINKKTLVGSDIQLPVFSQKVNGYWLRLPTAPTLKTFDNLSTMHEHFTQLMNASVPSFRKSVEAAKPGEVIIAGFVYKDEISWRESGDDWIFLAIHVQYKSKGSKPAKCMRTFVRADWGGVNALVQRAPHLQSLRNKTVVVVGLGSLGSPLVLNLARAGIGTMHLVDRDYLQVGNTIRWALGWEYAGIHKALALANHLKREYPYTSGHVYHMHIGSPPCTPLEKTDYDQLRLLIETSDVLVDASANHRVSHFLADLAKELGKPYLWLTTTHGAAGGVVGRIVPEKTPGCWHCFQHHLTDETIPLPADSGAEAVQPGGCSQATFIGAGVDSDEVALLASRLAVATLARDEAGGYSDFEWNVAIGSFSRNGSSIAPEWRPYPLDSHSSCKSCKQA